MNMSRVALCRFVVVFALLSTLVASPVAVLASEAGSRAAASPEVAVGRELFFDPRISADGTISCASCHRPESAYADDRPVSVGVHGLAGQRNAPSLLNVGGRDALFWDGRARTLEEQVSMPLTNSREQGFADMEQVVERIRAIPVYVSEFARLPRSPGVTADSVERAIAAFERTLKSESSDPGTSHGDVPPAKLESNVARGLDVFRGAGQCASCHRIDGHVPGSSDGQFHGSAKGVPASALQRLPAIVMQLQKSRASGGMAVGELIAADADIAALGRFVLTLDPKDVGMFRAPPLRGVSRTAPYMHDGSVATLEEAVELESYRAADGLKRPIPLTTEQRADLLSFLRAL